MNIKDIMQPMLPYWSAIIKLYAKKPLRFFQDRNLTKRKHEAAFKLAKQLDDLTDKDASADMPSTLTSLDSPSPLVLFFRSSSVHSESSNTPKVHTGSSSPLETDALWYGNLKISLASNLEEIDRIKEELHHPKAGTYETLVRTIEDNIKYIDTLFTNTKELLKTKKGDSCLRELEKDSRNLARGGMFRCMVAYLAKIDLDLRLQQAGLYGEYNQKSGALSMSPLHLEMVQQTLEITLQKLYMGRLLECQANLEWVDAVIINNYAQLVRVEKLIEKVPQIAAEFKEEIKSLREKTLAEFKELWLEKLPLQPDYDDLEATVTPGLYETQSLEVVAMDTPDPSLGQILTQVLRINRGMEVEAWVASITGALEAVDSADFAESLDTTEEPDMGKIIEDLNNRMRGGLQGSLLTPRL